jgi:hypothetical protein
MPTLISAARAAFQMCDFSKDGEASFWINVRRRSLLTSKSMQFLNLGGIVFIFGHDPTCFRLHRIVTTD